MKAFRFPAGSRLVADAVENVIATEPDDRIQRFIDYVRQQIEEAKTMKWLGDPE